MASRLPMPKIGLKKATSASNVAKLNPSTDLIVPKTQNTITTRLTVKPTKVNTVNENKPPGQALTRAKTLATISRGTVPAKTAVKRPGATTSSAIAPKRPNLRPATATVNSTAVSGKSLRPGGPAKPTVTKPAAPLSKWDWKGRFALANDELTSLKEKSKGIKIEYDELKSIVDDLRCRETESTDRAEKLEVNNENLTKELSEVKQEVTKLMTQNERLESELKESQETHKNTLISLKQCEETCRKQEQRLHEHSSKVEYLERNIQEKSDKVSEQTEHIKNLQDLVHQMDKDRRNLHNTIQELKGNIRVFCRVRPRIEKESGKTLCSVNYIDDCTIEIGRADGSDALSCTGKSRGTKQEFTFDKVFPPTASQADVFEELSMLVQSALEGYNVCVFAYGQTGSGKTHTMEGICNPDLEGMIPRTVRHIFHEMKEFKLLGWEYQIEASFLEIYNEHIVDLLDAAQKTHEIRMTDARGTDLYVTNLKTVEINNPEELHMWLRMAQQNRAVAATKANDRSSRSHSVARIKLIATHAEKEEMCVGNLNLVDLAGSERLKNEEATRTTETKNINKSLANLGNVILALLKKQDHVPYRNSKLTHLLMPSLGGNSKTLMLLNVSPLDECYNETLNSLRFASNVNSCKTGNIKKSKTLLQTSY